MTRTIESETAFANRATEGAVDRMAQAEAERLLRAAHPVLARLPFGRRFLRAEVSRVADDAALHWEYRVYARGRLVGTFYLQTK